MALQVCSSPTSMLECVHASVHVCMCTWLPMSAWPPLHSYVETWVPLCNTLCMFQSPFFQLCACPPDLPPLLYCICIVKCIHVCPCMALQACPIFWSHSLVRICACISTFVHVHLTSNICCTPLLSCMQICLPLYGPMWVSQRPFLSIARSLFILCWTREI